MAVTDCLCCRLYDWRRSMIACFINYVIEGDLWSLLLSTIWLYVWRRDIDRFLYHRFVWRRSLTTALMNDNVQAGKAIVDHLFSELTWLRTNGYLHSIDINNKPDSTHVSGKYSLSASDSPASHSHRYHVGNAAHRGYSRELCHQPPAGCWVSAHRGAKGHNLAALA